MTGKNTRKLLVEDIGTICLVSPKEGEYLPALISNAYNQGAFPQLIFADENGSVCRVAPLPNYLYKIEKEVDELEVLSGSHSGLVSISQKYYYADQLNAKKSEMKKLGYPLSASFLEKIKINLE